MRKGRRRRIGTEAQTCIFMEEEGSMRVFGLFGTRDMLVRHVEGEGEG